ncbi:MAG: hypothetical protein IT462_03960 [Planctomycetes bacterium]|nr:hypothetical protein [Planctomycetota bacterium]
MKTWPVLALLCLFAASSAAWAGPSTTGAAVKLPGLESPDVAKPLISPHATFTAHGDKTLATVLGRAGFSLWLIDGDSAQRVTGAGNAAVEAKVIECVLPGEPAIFRLSDASEKPGAFIRVDANKAQALRDAAGKPLSPRMRGQWLRSSTGEIVAMLGSGEKTETPYLLTGAALKPLTDALPNSSLLSCDPGGRIRLEPPPGHQRLLLINGAFIKPVTTPPQSDFASGEVLFNDFRSGLICSCGEPGKKCRSWIIKDGVSRWITDGAGEIFDGTWAYAMAVHNGAAEQIILPVFSYGEKGYGARFFRLDGVKAVEIKAPPVEAAANIVTCDAHGFIVSYMLKAGTRHFILKGDALVEIAFEKGFSPHEVKWCDGVKFADVVLVECFVGKRVALGALKDGVLTRVLECDRDLDRDCLSFVSDGKRAAATWTDISVHCVLVDENLAITPLSGPGGENGSTSPVSLHLCEGNLYAPWTTGKSAPLLRWQLEK